MTLVFDERERVWRRRRMDVQEQYFLVWSMKDRKMTIGGLFTTLEDARGEVRRRFDEDAPAKGKWRVDEQDGVEEWSIQTAAGTFHIIPLTVSGT